MTHGTQSGWRRFSSHRAALAALILLVALALIAAAAPLLFGHDAFAMVGQPFLWPGADARFPLGTDMFGRDILAGLVYGARVSLVVGVAAAALSTVLGIVVGLASGYFGGWIGNVLMRLTELFQTMPSMIFVVTIMAIFTPSITTIVLAIGLTSWPQTARLIRAETLRVRESEFISAAFALGLSPAHIVSRHILLNVISPAIVTATILAGTAILTEAGLAFLGLGDPNVMSWGSMIGTGRQVLRTAWYISAIPGLAIVLTVIAVTAIGNGISLVLNPNTDI
ncbi:Oligopeptide transport system permease protein OppC [Achromobacter veterisilvae]|uniref:Oligopeptide transport system permease protein OppC n=1 Tax=Achromobacter veterisilvae TaxID=2069367 RepID=A0A446CIG5_9BURK|nr:ABC transporter permease [Achromobacter veterisilvae]SSW67575.1 Oligopeptide transport system permease protein OppC [Achromobacter veterisilvae]